MVSSSRPVLAHMDRRRKYPHFYARTEARQGTRMHSRRTLCAPATINARLGEQGCLLGATLPNPVTALATRRGSLLYWAPPAGECDGASIRAGDARDRRARSGRDAGGNAPGGGYSAHTRFARRTTISFL
jgi:hypothetical protein